MKAYSRDCGSCRLSREPLYFYSQWETSLQTVWLIAGTEIIKEHWQTDTKCRSRPACKVGWLENLFQTFIEHEIMYLFTYIPLPFQLDVSGNISFLQGTCTGNTLILLLIETAIWKVCFHISALTNQST